MAKLVVIDDVIWIVLPSHASLKVGQRVALRAKSVTEMTGASYKDIWVCLAVCAHYRAGAGEAGICAVADCTASSGAKHRPIPLPVVADPAACQEHRSIDDAINGRTVGIAEGFLAVTTVDVPANTSSGPAPQGRWHLCCWPKGSPNWLHRFRPAQPLSLSKIASNTPRRFPDPQPSAFELAIGDGTANEASSVPLGNWGLQLLGAR
ncbi:hypothetical protein AAFX91_40860 [Bradyrhizobium sp. 31Argb]|uniref:hypothetical protein n=1 Tax=unclassified Bradyrhizobium TaxID=2631580 RepID=UPI001028DA8E|nr:MULTISPECIES: hypothetical protein [unclassified Bradyrhizobium]